MKRPGEQREPPWGLLEADRLLVQVRCPHNCGTALARIVRDRDRRLVELKAGGTYTFGGRQPKPKLSWDRYLIDEALMRLCRLDRELPYRKGRQLVWSEADGCHKEVPGSTLPPLLTGTCPRAGCRRLLCYDYRLLAPHIQLAERTGTPVSWTPSTSRELAFSEREGRLFRPPVSLPDVWPSLMEALAPLAQSTPLASLDNEN